MAGSKLRISDMAHNVREMGLKERGALPAQALFLQLHRHAGTDIFDYRDPLIQKVYILIALSLLSMIPCWELLRGKYKAL